uniref:Uncharacterized protein n=1 Tax=Chromera velia CCMP2878 TaxID=1169474 RepID=A0A0G4HG73_9ALVE|eukprot:Cvel_6695.t1-p1 / transcript=Cvel_6695.t1 / gene=Cvel_6695 / organism=Chromera_velia_CCMP2878 / gene_product=Bicaudal D-related protein 1, putative / transcript_product=Bicaudal D-related protein 1, putative / location=Cvel_scaffold333:90750-96376(-) / protein_length=519 / sequence_SO=supercontig / SO=protein_coding / is_pseudo=false
MSSVALDNQAGEKDDKELPEVQFAELETRMRRFIVDLLEPTMKRVQQQQVDLSSLKTVVDRHAKSLSEVAVMTVKAEQNIGVVEQLREEMSKWDVQRRNQEAKVSEDISLMKHELDGFRYNLERKEASIQALQRTSERAVAEVQQAMDAQDSFRQYVDGRLEAQVKHAHAFRTDLEVKLVALETKHNGLADELWGEETGLAKVTGELNRTNLTVSSLSEEVKRLNKSKASTQQCDMLQDSIRELVKETKDDVKDLRDAVGGVVSEVKEHFKTAANQIAAHNASMLSELELKQLKKRLSGVFDNSDLVLKGLEHITGVIAILIESNKVAASLDVQDDDDRRRVALMGYKEAGGKEGERSGSRTTRARSGNGGGAAGDGATVISVDPRCLSCSGQAATVLAGFKMACLQYAPQPVRYNKKLFNRGDLIAVRSQLLEQCFDALQSGPDLRFAGGQPQVNASHRQRESAGDSLGQTQRDREREKDPSGGGGERGRETIGSSLFGGTSMGASGFGGDGRRKNDT